MSPGPWDELVQVQVGRSALDRPLGALHPQAGGPTLNSGLVRTGPPGAASGRQGLKEAGKSQLPGVGAGSWLCLRLQAQEVQVQVGQGPARRGSPLPSRAPFRLLSPCDLWTMWPLETPGRAGVGDLMGSWALLSPTEPSSPLYMHLLLVSPLVPVLFRLILGPPRHLCGCELLPAFRSPPFRSGWGGTEA